MESKLELKELKPITKWSEVESGDKVICIQVPRDNPTNPRLVLGGTYTVAESLPNPYEFVGRDYIELENMPWYHLCYRFALAPKEETKKLFKEITK
jgi:hypothetical protein